MMAALAPTAAPIVYAVSGIAAHPADDRVLEAALSAEAQYLVSGDAALLRLGVFRGVSLCTARDFLAHLQPAGT